MYGTEYDNRAMRQMEEILSKAEEAGLIKSYAETPEVPRFAIETTDGLWLQVEVIPGVAKGPAGTIVPFLKKRY